MTVERASAQAIVTRGYDTIAEHYASWANGIEDPSRERYTRLLVDRLPSGATLLDLGCGGGASSRVLAERFTVTGVDSSCRQIEVARRHAPSATFLMADMVEQNVPLCSFDAVTVFYALSHVPREEHAALLLRIAGWLRPGGLFVASIGTGDAPGEIDPDWLGAPMFFSHFNAVTTRWLVVEAGLELEPANVVTLWEYEQPVDFLWIVARK